jgi:hypothetical protein
MILLISASQIARITGVRHWHLVPILLFWARAQGQPEIQEVISLVFTSQLWGMGRARCCKRHLA